MGILGFLKRKPQESEPQRKSAEYKTFQIVKFKRSPINQYVLENEDFELGKKAILDNGLEDSKIYRYSFDHLRPSIVDNGNGYDVIVHDQTVGMIDAATADSLDDFLDAHPDHELLLSVEGGTYKCFDSDSEEMISGSDKYTARICVKYYK